MNALRRRWADYMCDLNGHIWTATEMRTFVIIRHCKRSPFHVRVRIRN